LASTARQPRSNRYLLGRRRRRGRDGVVGGQHAQVAGRQVHGHRVALLALDLLVVIGDVGLDQRPVGQAHAHLLVKAEVDDLLDHAGHAVLAGRSVRLQAHVLRADHCDGVGARRAPGRRQR
jgi:hypothetical protein